MWGRVMDLETGVMLLRRITIDRTVLFELYGLGIVMQC